MDKKWYWTSFAPGKRLRVQLEARAMLRARSYSLPLEESYPTLLDFLEDILPVLGGEHTGSLK